jgi:hypothetical protein
VENYSQTGIKILPLAGFLPQYVHMLSIGRARRLPFSAARRFRQKAEERGVGLLYQTR